MAMVNVVLHGAIREAYPKPIRIEAKTARIALNALKLIPELSPFKNKLRYLCKVDVVQSATDMDEPLEVDTINVYCEKILNKGDIQGSGDNPYVQMVIGVVLIIIGIIVIGMSGTLATPIGTALIASGISMILGGTLQLLTKHPKVDTENEKNKSNTGYENTVKSGTPIPLIIGEHLHGGHIFSLNTETRQGKNLDISDFKAKFAPGKSESWLLLYDGTDDVPTNTKPPGGGGGGGGGGSDGDPGVDGNPWYPQMRY